ncbi:N-acetyltransferase [Micrococcus sp. M4NT]|uniref:GNAT family N-acetyltransferase n=1 Tax=Micrococcus sp. M4NT TaxID=2957501 RepID=UPI0029BF0CEE|nr:N-acetyltransferase [Micrococcus sp. M4NT]MDX2341447.1 N-acetyltransferase [Micrococcus sp. M4NT]
MSIPQQEPLENGRTARVPREGRLGHRWPTRVADPASEGDGHAIRRITQLAFESDAEARLVEELRQDEGAWLSRYSMVAMIAAIPGTDLHSDPVAYGVLVRARIGDEPTLALAPHGVLPEHQNQGAGTAVVEALLEAAQRDGEKHVVVYGWPEYYSGFGFRPAGEHGVTAGFARQPEALQVLVLDETAEVPAGEFRYPEAFGADNAQVAGRD